MGKQLHIERGCIHAVGLSQTFTAHITLREINNKWMATIIRDRGIPGHIEHKEVQNFGIDPERGVPVVSSLMALLSIMKEERVFLLKQDYAAIESGYLQGLI